MITDRKTPKRNSLIRYLSLNYLLFTGSILLILLSIYGIYTLYARRMAPIPDLEGLCRKAASWSEETGDSLDLQRYLGTGGKVCITDASGRLLYSSNPDHREDYTAGELSCIPLYNSNSRLLTAKLPEGSENGTYLITQTRYDDQGNLRIDGYLFLNSDLTVRSGSIQTGRTFFTPLEFQYLSGKDSAGRTLLRMDYTNVKGEKRHLVTAFYEAGPATYEELYRVWNHLWLLFIPAYLLTAALFILLMTKKAQGFLNPLN